MPLHTSATTERITSILLLNRFGINMMYMQIYFDHLYLVISWISELKQF
jgi:hypothetical protein